jgi:exodeoxyribonuclease VII small subunit
MSEKENFEAALRALEEAVERLESGKLSLEESLALFETGVKGAALCQKILKDVEARVELLLAKDGTFTVENFDES